MKKNTFKVILDLVIFITVALLYRSRSTGLAFHEIAGLAIFGVFFVHLGFNWKAVVRNLSKLFSRDQRLRIRLSYISAILLFVCFTLIIVSGIFMSQILFPELGLANRATSWRIVHEFCSGLSIIFLGAHLGLNWTLVKGVFAKIFQLPAQAGRILGIVAMVLVLLVGSFSLVTSNFRDLLMSPISGDQTATGRMRFPGGVPSGFPTDRGQWSGRGRGSGERPASGELPDAMPSQLPSGMPTTRPDFDPSQQPNVDPSQLPNGGSFDPANGQFPQGADFPGQRVVRGRGGSAAGVISDFVTYASLIGFFGTITYLCGEFGRRKRKAVLR